jgi:hypothetical protein
MAGSNPALDDGFLRWDVTGGKLRILLHGEEGEHGEYEEYDYKLEGNRLTLGRPILGDREFTAQNRKIR